MLSLTHAVLTAAALAGHPVELGICFQTAAAPAASRGEAVLTLYGVAGSDDVVGAKLGRGVFVPADGLFTNSVMLRNHAHGGDTFRSFRLANPTRASWVSHGADLTVQTGDRPPEDTKVECFDAGSEPRLGFVYRDLPESATFRLYDGDPEPTEAEIKDGLRRSALGKCGGGILGETPLVVRRTDGRCTWARGCEVIVTASATFTCREERR